MKSAFVSHNIKLRFWENTIKRKNACGILFEQQYNIQTV